MQVKVKYQHLDAMCRLEGNTSETYNEQRVSRHGTCTKKNDWTSLEALEFLENLEFHLSCLVLADTSQ